MKKVLIALAIFFGIIIAALIIIPTFFKDDILKLIQKESSKYMNAELNIGDLNLSMFKSFPSLNVGLSDVSIVGKDRFQGDTIVNMPSFEASVNIKSLISGNEIVINKIWLKNTTLTAKVDTSGNANWDIIIAGDTLQQVKSEEKEEKSGKSIRFNDIVIENLHMSYTDYQSNIFAGIEDTDMKLSGNFSETNTLIDILLNLNNITFRQQDKVWLNNTDLNWQAEIGANLKDLIFEIRKNELAVNELKLDLTGSVAVDSNKYKLDLLLNAPDTKFESLLALLPKDYKEYIKDIQTSGEFKLNAKAQGEYYTGHMPAFEAGIMISNARVKYPDLPESIENINLNLNISNPGGSVDRTVVDLQQMSFAIANNPFNLHMKVTNLNDPSLSGGAKGVINFTSLKKALPLKDITLQGIVTTDVTFDGKYQYIEKQQYEKFTAKGTITLNDVLFKNTDFPQGVSIPHAALVVTPAQLNLTNLQAKIFSSDFALKGSISNYLPYIFKNETLRGNFTMSSNRINLNEFTGGGPTPKDSTQQSNTSTQALEIPRNIDIQLNTNVNTLLFDQLAIRNIKGNLKLSDGIARLSNLQMNMFEGNLAVSGAYNSQNLKAPKFDFDLNISDFDIRALYNSFSFIKQSLPIAMDCSGKISSAMKFSGTLDKDMNLLMNTTNGSGYIDSKGILINNNPAMNQLATILKNDELSRISISSLKINFKIQNGNIIIEPFNTTLAGNPVTIYGSQTVDGQLDYTLSMNVNRKYFGKDINNLLKAIPGSDRIESLDIDARVGGTLSKPTIKPDLTKALNSLKKEAEKELKNKAKDEIIKGLNKLFK